MVFEYPSHTATDNVLMAAVLAKGTTVIENAAREPEVADLAAFLGRMGGRIRGAGTSRIEIDGCDELHPAPEPHRVVPDRVVSATLFAAVGVAGGDILVEDARIDHMDMVVRKMGEIGVAVTQTPEGLRASAEGRLHSVDVATLPVSGRGHRLQAVPGDHAVRGRRRRASSPRTSFRAASATSTSCAAWVRTCAPRATTPWCGACAGYRVPRCAPPTCVPVPPWCWPGWWPRARRWCPGAGHIDRGYEDLAATLRSLGADVSRA